MCVGTFCTELGADRSRWSRAAPLPPPSWFGSELVTFSRAARAAASGDVVRSAELLSALRSAEMRQWYTEHGQRSGFFRVPTASRTPHAAHGKRVRLPPVAQLDSILTRDAFRCRYCTTPVVPLLVLKWLSRVLGVENFRAEGGGNSGKHGAVLAFRANFDHVVPLALGGANDDRNLVTCCWSCNYGKRAFTLDELGLEDPRDRPPIVDGWDGLVSQLEGLRNTARRGAGARSSA